MSNPIHPRLDVPLAVGETLIFVARELTRIANTQLMPRRRRRGATVRPGPSTPMWNALSLAVRAQLRVHGEKSRLARILGVPPQRVHEFLMAKSAMPDAERTLLLLVWLSQKQTRAGEPG
jgi:hypothetical protein